jgi:hypothetical protein
MASLMQRIGENGPRAEAPQDAEVGRI